MGRGVVVQMAYPSDREGRTRLDTRHIEDGQSITFFGGTLIVRDVEGRIVFTASERVVVWAENHSESGD